MTEGTPGFDVLTIGRVSVDLYPEQVSTKLAEVRTFRKMLGGSPTNVAVAAARLGRRAGVVTKVGADGFGDYVRAALAEFGVDGSYVGTHPTLRTPLAFCEIFPPDDFPLLFYREPTAPDLTIDADELPRAEISGASIFWVTGTGLSAEPSRAATLEALRLRGRSSHTVLDLDLREALWSSRTDVTAIYGAALEYATVAVGNAGEAAVVTGALEPAEAAAALLESGVDLAIVKLGGEGVLAATTADTVRVSGVEIEVLNGLGAGDAFGGALCHGLLAGWELDRTIRFANAAGALVASRLGCADDMPTAEEVEQLLCAA